MKRIAVLAATVAAVATMVGCSSTPPTTQEPNEPASLTNTDPKLGWVLIWDEPDPEYRDEVYIRCHGTTLLYMRADIRAGIDAVPNDPLCTTKK